jgi:hypothetical protein
MPSYGRRSGPAARRNKVTRRDARRARDELAGEALSHRDQRRLRTIIRTWELASRRRHQEFRHLAIVVMSGIAAMAVIGAALGLGPAIEAAAGNGAIGTFVVDYSSCSARVGCVWVGTFDAHDDVVPGVVYEGSMPTNTAPGTRIPARYPGDRRAYAPHGSHTWAWDLVPMLFIGSTVAFVVWLSPLGIRQRRTTSAA